MEKFNYEEKRKQYEEQLRENIDIVKAILDEKEGEEKRNMSKLFLSPSNEYELRVASGMLQFTSDLQEAIMGVAFGTVEEIEPEDNFGLEWLINIAKQSQNGKIEKIAPDDMSSADVAKLLYGLGVGLIGNPEKSLEYMSRQLGYDPENEVDMLRMNALFEESKELIGACQTSKQPDFTKSEDFNEKNVAEFEEFTNCFHELCLNGKKKEEDIEPGKLLSRLFGELGGLLQ